MKTYKRYSVGFKEQALVKVYNRSNDQTIELIANELNINVTTLKDWMKQSKQTLNKAASPTSKRPMDWLPEERLTALQQPVRWVEAIAETHQNQAYIWIMPKRSCVGRVRR
jgi:hypothetical protein